MTGKRPGVFDLVRSGDRDGLAILLSGYPALASALDDGGTPLLHVAVEMDEPEMIEVILDGGADRDVESPWGQTPLEWAASLGSRRAAEVLLRRGAPSNLWVAAALGRFDEVRDFLDGATESDGLGRTPGAGADLRGWPESTPYRTGDPVSDAFYIACRNGALDVAHLLHEQGADPDATGYFGATALHWAAHNGHADVVVWLLEIGADVGRRDPKFDATPAGWAREGGHVELARRLEEQGA